MNQFGVSLQEAGEALQRLGGVARTIPFPECEELRAIRLRAWKRDYGALRFFAPGWWKVVFRLETT